MTSLLPIQYVTPHSITSTSASSVVELNSTSNTEKQRQQQQQQQRHPHFQQQRWYNNSALTTASLDGSLPSVTVVKPRSTPNATTTASNTRLAYVDALVGTYFYMNRHNLKSKHMWIRCKCACYRIDLAIEPCGYCY